MFFKIKIVNQDNPEINSEFILRKDDVLMLSDDTGLNENKEKLRRLAILMKQTVMTQRPKLGPDGKPVLNGRGQPILTKSEEPITYYIYNQEEIERIKSQFN